MEGTKGDDWKGGRWVSYVKRGVCLVKPEMMME
jgi:hypothetical protein